MAWNTLTTFAGSNVPTAAELNPFSDNLTFLRTPVVNDYYEANEASNITTTSTTFADISANFTKTFTMSGGYVLCLFSCVCTKVALDWCVDGVRRGDATLGSAHWASSSDAIMVTMPLPLTGLSVGSHTVSVQWRVSVSGTATIYTAYGARFYVIQRMGG